MREKDNPNSGERFADIDLEREKPLAVLLCIWQSGLRWTVERRYGTDRLREIDYPV